MVEISKAEVQKYQNYEQQSTSVKNNNTADAQLREAFSYDNSNNPPEKQKFDVNQLDYSGFPKKNKVDAFDFARRSLNEIKDAAREFNADFPQNPYVPNTSIFPKPENFTKKQFGGKEQAYTAWKSAVTEWVEDCKQDMVSAKNGHINSMSAKLENIMKSGFFQIYLELGITQQEIQQAFEATNGNINDLKEMLDKKANELKQNMQRGFAGVNTNTNRAVGVAIDKINSNTDYQASEIHRHLDHTERQIHRHIDESTEATQNHFEERSDDIIDEIHNDGDKTRERIEELQSEVMKKLEKMPTKKSLVIDFIKGTLHLPIDAAKAGFNLASYLLSLPVEALKKIVELLD